LRRVIVIRKGTQVLISRIDPLKEEPVTGSVLSSTQSYIRVLFPSTFDIEDTLWRLDLGRPNLIWERMRAAISYLQDDPAQAESVDAGGSSETVLQGTYLRDILLRSFPSNPVATSPMDTMYLAEDGEVGTTAASEFMESKHVQEPQENKPNFSGVFKEDCLIQSWAERYSKANPVIVEGDPPLTGLNSSQIRAMATMIGNKVSLVQGVRKSHYFSVRYIN